MNTVYKNGTAGLVLTSPGNITSNIIETGLYRVSDREEVQDELFLSIMMVLNSWVLVQNNPPKGCVGRSMCELNQNGAVWGGVAGLVVDLSTRVMAGWVADNRQEEEEMVLVGEMGRRLVGCDNLSWRQCPLRLWNKFVRQQRSNVLQLSLIHI